MFNWRSDICRVLTVHQCRLLFYLLAWVLSASCSAPTTRSISIISKPETEISLLNHMFEKIPLQGSTLQLHDNSLKTRRQLNCAAVCGEKRLESPGCQAFRHDPETKLCELYTNDHDDDDDNGSSSLQVFRYQRMDWFHTMTSDGRMYSILLSGRKMSFLDARHHCASLGGYLLQFNHLDKYTIVEKLWGDMDDFSQGRAFVGASDIEEEGTWRNEKDQSVVMSSGDPTWLWNTGEPNNGGGDEDCAVLSFSTYGLNDIPCSYEEWFFCERDE